MADYCEDCGCRVYGGYCVNCDEEVFIEEQYVELGEAPPVSIAKVAEGRRSRKREIAND